MHSVNCNKSTKMGFCSINVPSVGFVLLKKKYKKTEFSCKGLIKRIGERTREG